jgi:hypothetical protein
MSTTSPLENKLYARRFDDGLIDLFVAIGLIAIGASWMLDAPAYGVIAPAVLVPVWKQTRKQLIEPRLEAVTFSPEREAKTRGSMMAWLIFGAAVLLTEIAIFLYASRAEGSIIDRLSEFVVALPAALVAVGLLGGLMVGAWRFAGYAAAALGVAVIGALRGVDDPGLLILVIGALVLGGAVALLARFFKSHPAPETHDAV